MMIYDFAMEGTAPHRRCRPWASVFSGSPDDWNLQFCRKVFARRLEDGFRITWKSVAQWDPAPLLRGTFVQGLNNGKHTIELSGTALQGNGLTALRIYRSPFPQTEDPAADVSGK